MNHKKNGYFKNKDDIIYLITIIYFLKIKKKIHLILK